MTKEQIALVQDSWREVVLVADSASAMFYSRLFAIDPEAGALFAAADMRKQRITMARSAKRFCGCSRRFWATSSRRRCARHGSRPMP